MTLNLSLLPCHAGDRAVSVGSQLQQHLKDGSAYRQLRPTTLDKIKNLHIDAHLGPVGRACFPSARTANERDERRPLLLEQRPFVCATKPLTQESRSRGGAFSRMRSSVSIGFSPRAPAPQLETLCLGGDRLVGA